MGNTSSLKIHFELSKNISSAWQAGNVYLYVGHHWDWNTSLIRSPCLLQDCYMNRKSYVIPVLRFPDLAKEKERNHFLS